MKFAITDECASITYTPDFGNLALADSVEITVKINCCSDDYTVTDITPYLASNVVTLPPSVFSQTGDALLDGVYHIKVTATYGTSIAVDQTCLFVNCQIKCLVVDKYAEEFDTSIIYHHRALELAGECFNDCNCESACAIYEDLLEKLEAESTINNDCCCG